MIENISDQLGLYTADVCDVVKVLSEDYPVEIAVRMAEVASRLMLADCIHHIENDGLTVAIQDDSYMTINRVNDSET